MVADFRFVYVANEGSDSISVFRIAEDGALISVPGSSLAVGDPISMALDSLGRFLYVINFEGSVSAYSIGENGFLTPVIGSPFPTGIGTVSFAVDSLRRLAYVINTTVNINNIIDTVSAYRIGANGALTLVTGSTIHTGSTNFIGVAPGHVVVDPLGQFVYVTNQYSEFVENNFVEGSIAAFQIGKTGFLTPINGSPIPAGIFPEGAAVNHLGRFLYVANYYGLGGLFGFPGSVSAYSIGKNGALTPIAGSPFPAGFGASAVAISP